MKTAEKNFVVNVLSFVLVPGIAVVLHLRLRKRLHFVLYS